MDIILPVNHISKFERKWKASRTEYIMENENYICAQLHRNARNEPEEACHRLRNIKSSRKKLYCSNDGIG